MRELEVVGVRVEMPNNSPIVLLREVGGDRFLPIWSGPHEAAAIAHAQQGLSHSRPLTHDLLRNVIEALGKQLVEVRITELRDDIFIGALVFAGDVVVDARSTDSIALALRAGVKIMCADEVLAEAGVPVPESEETEEEQVAEFREFLDRVTPEDFEQPG